MASQAVWSRPPALTPYPPSLTPHLPAPMCRINGLTHLNLTKLDVLSDLEEIKVGRGARGAGQ